MVTLVVERRYGHTTMRARVSAPTFERALRLCGADARVVSSIDQEDYSRGRSDAGLAGVLPAEATGRRAVAA